MAEVDSWMTIENQTPQFLRGSKSWLLQINPKHKFPERRRLLWSINKSKKTGERIKTLQLLQSKLSARSTQPLLYGQVPRNKKAQPFLFLHWFSEEQDCLHDGSTLWQSHGKSCPGLGVSRRRRVAKLQLKKGSNSLSIEPPREGWQRLPNTASSITLINWGRKKSEGGWEYGGQG